MWNRNTKPKRLTWKFQGKIWEKRTWMERLHTNVISLCLKLQLGLWNQAGKTLFFFNGKTENPLLLLNEGISSVWIWTNIFTKLHFLEISLRSPDIRSIFQNNSLLPALPEKTDVLFKKLLKRIKNTHSCVMLNLLLLICTGKNHGQQYQINKFDPLTPHPATGVKFRILGLPLWKKSHISWWYPFRILEGGGGRIQSTSYSKWRWRCGPTAFKRSKIPINQPGDGRIHGRRVAASC